MKNFIINNNFLSINIYHQNKKNDAACMLDTKRVLCVLNCFGQMVVLIETAMTSSTAQVHHTKSLLTILQCCLPTRGEERRQRVQIQTTAAEPSRLRRPLRSAPTSSDCNATQTTQYHCVFKINPNTLTCSSTQPPTPLQHM